MASAKEDGVDKRTVDIKEEECERLTPEVVCVKLEDHEERISVFKEEECKGVTAAIKAEDLNDFSIGLELQKHETEDIFKQEACEESPSSLQPWPTNTGRLATQENSAELKSELLESEEKITERNEREGEESPGRVGINLQKNDSFSPPSFGQHSPQYKEKGMKKSARGSENLTAAFLQCSSLSAAGVTQTEAIKTDQQQVEKEIQIHNGKKCCAFALNLQLTMASKQVKSGSVGEKKGLKKIEIELKKEIIEKYERGVRVTDLAAEYKKSKSTISTILKQKEAIKAADVAKGVTMLTKQRPQVLEDVEKLLLVWLNEKQLAGDSVSEAMLCEKARRIHCDLLQNYPSTSGEGEEFKASRGWFENFRKRSGIHGVLQHREAASSNAEAAKNFVKMFTKFVKDQGYIPQQVFNCDETGLFWNRMPKRTYITQEEKAMPGHKPMKDRLTVLLCANASGDVKIKPLVVYQFENPCAFKQHNLNKATLPVMWRANTRGWVTRTLFLEWLHEAFAPAVKRYLKVSNLPEKCLLLMDNAPAHPPNLVDDMVEEYNFIKVMFLPSNTTPLLQPMDQQVISNFKKLYTKGLFARCFNVTKETSLTLKEFWKNHFKIVHCINLIDKAWEDVTYLTLSSAWKKLWPECVPEQDLERFDLPVVDEIVSMGKSMGLEVDNEDIEELVLDHKEELTTEELTELQQEQHKLLTEDQSSGEEEERAVLKSDAIKAVMEKWNECQDFFEKNHPDKAVANRVINMMNDNVVSHFRKILMRRKRQVTLDSYFAKSDPPAKQLKTPETRENT
ncbi:tigger transposable element-derived protein 1-like [Erpetoichthys calabaricus]|uniref:tigger transposable element-derived protein 1-like n=1 Tax=Erpetoichthys calabaricus TaxID=27687 RepID=UPI00223485B6|nr:tigger transposable element-derived protein 1-like [Erpetoichthys calabaricus]